MNSSWVTKTSSSRGFIWCGGTTFVAMQICNLYDSKLWSFSECTGCSTVFHAFLIRVQTSSRDLHTFQHALYHLAEENTEYPQIRAGNGCHKQQKYQIDNTENTKKDKDVQHIPHRTGFLTRLQWLRLPLAAGNNYRCGLDLDPVVFSSQWNMGPSLKYKKTPSKTKPTNPPKQILKPFTFYLDFLTKRFYQGTGELDKLVHCAGKTLFILWERMNWLQLWLKYEHQREQGKKTHISIKKTGCRLKLRGKTDKASCDTHSTISAQSTL